MFLRAAEGNSRSLDAQAQLKRDKLEPAFSSKEINFRTGSPPRGAH
jgi:hypothetical protein